jgi:peroxiredoxin
VLVVFLRHSGCIFCRETLHDIARSRSLIEKRGTRIVLVHMGDIQAMEKALAKHKLSLLDRICDPMQELYRAFGLKRGRFLQLFGPHAVWRTLRVAARHGIGRASADPAQMPGVFLIAQSAIIRRFRHRSVADRPDYLALSAP